MKAVFTIVDYSLAGKLDEVFKKENVFFKLQTHGYGSAESEVLEYFGLGENKKAVFISIMRKENIPNLYKRLERKMNLSNRGTGICFSVPLTSMSAVISKMYNVTIDTNQPNGGSSADMENQYDLIITIVSRGYFDIVKNAAKSAGARGGTLIHGLGIGGEEAAKFLGIKLQPEKDIVLIVVNHEDKATIMHRIIEDAGILKESRGVCFAIPVETAYGLADKFSDLDADFDNEQDK